MKTNVILLKSVAITLLLTFPIIISLFVNANVHQLWLDYSVIYFVSAVALWFFIAAIKHDIKEIKRSKGRK